MPKVPGYSDEDLALLTDDELAGLIEATTGASDDDGAPDDTTDAGDADDTLQAGDADDTVEGEEQVEAAGAEEGAAEGEVQEEAVPATPAAPDVQADAAPIEVEIEDLPPQPITFNIAEARSKIETIEKDIDALAKQADDGEIDYQTMVAKTRQLEDQRADLKADIRDTERSINSAVTSFQSHGAAFLAKPENAVYRSGALNVLLDTTIRQVQELALREGKNAFDPKILDKAVAIVDGQLSSRFGKAAPAKPAPGDKPTREKPSRPSMMPNLSTMPSADDGGDPLGGGGEYAMAARLAESDPLKYEKLLSSWSRDKMEDFLSKAHMYG